MAEETAKLFPENIIIQVRISGKWKERVALQFYSRLTRLQNLFLAFPLAYIKPALFTNLAFINFPLPKFFIQLLVNCERAFVSCSSIIERLFLANWVSHLNMRTCAYSAVFGNYYKILKAKWKMRQKKSPC